MEQVRLNTHTTHSHSSSITSSRGEPDMWRDTQLLKRLFNLQLGQVGCYGNTKRNQRLERGARKRSRRKKEDVLKASRLHPRLLGIRILNGALESFVDGFR